MEVRPFPRFWRRSAGECSASVRARVVRARERQRDRLGSKDVRTNSRHPQMMARDCGLDSAGLRLLAAAVRRLGLTARGYDRVRKVAAPLPILRAP